MRVEGGKGINLFEKGDQVTRSRTTHRQNSVRTAGSAFRDPPSTVAASLAGGVGVEDDPEPVEVGSMIEGPSAAARRAKREEEKGLRRAPVIEFAGRKTCRGVDER
jgi:UDP-N-acetylenolpyruvoylglucosamine reductase